MWCVCVPNILATVQRVSEHVPNGLSKCAHNDKYTRRDRSAAHCTDVVNGVKYAAVLFSSQNDYVVHVMFSIDLGGNSIDKLISCLENHGGDCLYALVSLT